MVSHTFQVAASKLQAWKNDFELYCLEEFGVELDEWQKEFGHYYMTRNRVAAKACKGPGKTAVLALCAWHFLTVNRHPKVAATSITGDNLRDNLWAEMAKWQQRSKTGFTKNNFTWRAERITCNDHPETWWMSARKFSKDADKEQQANTLAGLHAENIMYILDESGGIPDAVMAAAEGILANEGINAKILQAGNPTHLTGPLYRACTKEASLWAVVTITGDPDNPKRSKRISKQWALDMIKKYGRDNSWVLVSVFGEFPPSSLNALLGPDAVEAAMKRVIPYEAYFSHPKVLGVDVALQGGDRTVIAPRQGLVCFRPKILRSDDVKQIAGVVAVAAKKFKPDDIFVDNTGGWGSGVISWLQEWGHQVTGVQFAGKALDPIYYNKRTEIIHELAAFVRDGGGALPDIDDLKEELTAQTYIHRGNQLLMEPKEIIKDKLGRSPDIADAYALTFSFPVERKGALESKFRKNNGGRNDYDPMGGVDKANQTGVDDYNPLG